MTRARVPGLAAALALVAVPLAAETLRPLVTEDAETLLARSVEFQLAAEWMSDFKSPARPLEGTLLRGPVAAINAGLGDRAELQLRVPLRQRFSPEGEEPPRSATGDATIATKLRLLGGRGLGPGLAGRIQVKLPNLSETSGIGTDETDVTLEVIGQVELAGVKLLASAGYAILGDPRTPASQNDKVVLGLAGVLPLGLFELVGDVHGLALADRGVPDRWVALGGAVLPLGRLRLDGALGIESVEGDRSLLATAGASLTLALP